MNITKQKTVNSLIVFLFAIGLSGLQAQTLLNVKEKLGAQTLFALSGLNKLIFSSDKMTVIKKTGNNSDFSLINIRYLNFTNTTAINEMSDSRNSNLKLFPNPVIDLLNIQFESANEENVLIQIMNVQGKILYQQRLTNQTGINNLSIPLESFQKGLYLCQLIHGNKLEINKFVKN